MKASELYSINAGWIFEEFFSQHVSPWQWLDNIETAINECAKDDSEFFRKKELPPAVHFGENVFIHKTVKLPAFASIEGPAYVGPFTEIRPGAYIRKNVIVGKNCVLGNSCEYKNSILLDNVQTPHYNYVGDSILGNNTHLGAGVILSNLRFDQKDITITSFAGEKINTGLRKLGSLLGDSAEVGCNSSMQPGSILGKNSVVYPVTSFSGTLEASKIFKGKI